MEPTITQNGALYALQHSPKKPQTSRIDRALRRLLASIIPFAKHLIELIELIRRQWSDDGLATVSRPVLVSAPSSPILAPRSAAAALSQQALP